MDIFDVDDLMNGGGDDAAHHVLCSDCGGRGWYAYHSPYGDPPEQVPCERCYGSGYIPEHTMTEAERARYNDMMVAMAEDAAVWEVTVGDGLDEEDHSEPAESLLDDEEPPGPYSPIDDDDDSRS